MAVKWLDEPEAHDYDAAADYLSMVAEPGSSRRRSRRCASPTGVPKGKGHLRAAGLALLPRRTHT